MSTARVLVHCCIVFEELTKCIHEHDIDEHLKGQITPTFKSLQLLSRGRVVKVDSAYFPHVCSLQCPVDQTQKEAKSLHSCLHTPYFKQEYFELECERKELLGSGQ